MFIHVRHIILEYRHLYIRQTHNITVPPYLYTSDIQQNVTATIIHVRHITLEYRHLYVRQTHNISVPPCLCTSDSQH